MPRSFRITVVSNLDAEGQPVMENESLGSGEVVWHSDNSHDMLPPTGSFLLARGSYHPQAVAPHGIINIWPTRRCRTTSKSRISGRYSKHDSSRNSAGRLRVGVKKPGRPWRTYRAQIIRWSVSCETGKPALYLGRRRVYPSQYIIDFDEAEGEALLDFLWAHATEERLQYTHTWQDGDMVLWNDNRCCMHYREPLTVMAPRVLHRTQIEYQAPIPA